MGEPIFWSYDKFAVLLEPGDEACESGWWFVDEGGGIRYDDSSGCSCRDYPCVEEALDEYVTYELAMQNPIDECFNRGMPNHPNWVYMIEAAMAEGLLDG